jgi:hypothetical protein
MYELLLEKTVVVGLGKAWEGLECMWDRHGLHPTNSVNPYNIASHARSLEFFVELVQEVAGMSEHDAYARVMKAVIESCKVRRSTIRIAYSE